MSIASFFVRDVGLRRLFGAGCAVEDVEEATSALLLLNVVVVDVVINVTAVPLHLAITLVAFLVSDITHLLDDDTELLDEAEAQIS